MKLCSKCGLEKDEEEGFHKNAYQKYGYANWCKSCTSDYGKQWKINNPDKEEARRAASRRQREECKQKVLDHYGPKCSCCGESNPLFLTVEHLNGGGRKHRRSMGTQTINVWLVNNGLPEGFTILCYNCNCGKRVNGGVCPHQQ